MSCIIWNFNTTSVLWRIEMPDIFCAQPWPDQTIKYDYFIARMHLQNQFRRLSVCAFFCRWLAHSRPCLYSICSQSEIQLVSHTEQHFSVSEERNWTQKAARARAFLSLTSPRERAKSLSHALHAPHMQQQQHSHCGLHFALNETEQVYASALKIYKLMYSATMYNIKRDVAFMTNARPLAGKKLLISHRSTETRRLLIFHINGPLLRIASHITDFSSAMRMRNDRGKRLIFLWLCYIFTRVLGFSAQVFKTWSNLGILWWSILKE